jgi:hypothetical protein
VEVVDGWAELGERYERGTFEELTQFGEQLIQVRRLLLADTQAKARMAVVLLDSLADTLLHERCQQVYRAGEEGGTYRHQALRLTAAEKRELERDFRGRVTLASAPIEGWFPHRRPPLLTAGDAEVFRIAHAYRNPAYHQGRDNPQTLPLIARIFFAAVLRAWPRMQMTIGLGRSDSLERGLQALRELGLLPTSYDPEVFWFQEEVRRMGPRLLRGLRVQLEQAKQVLAADLLMRAAADQVVLADLKRDGLPPDQVQESLAQSEMWDELLDDRELMKVERERRELARRLQDAFDSGRRPRRHDHQRLAELDSHYAKAMFARRDGFKGSLSLGLLERMPRRVQRLRASRRMAELLRIYRQLDSELDALERPLWEIARGWDEHLQAETDRLRGN